MNTKRDEVLRLILLDEEGLLCRSCHKELASREEIDAGICLACVRLEALNELEVTATDEEDSCL